jgi:arylsulfatase
MSHYAYGLGWGSASAGPLDLFKMTVAEGGIRTPLLIAGPNVNGGRQVDAFAYVWDLMPTILDYAGIEHGTTFRGHEVEPMRGRSMASLLDGSADAVYADDEFVGGEMQNGKWMRQGNFKAVTVSPPYGDGVWRLFDVVSDPGETQDLAAQEAEKLEELQAAWEQYAQDVGVILTN